MKWTRPYATSVHIQAKLGQENLLRMVRWVKWHCPPDTRFEIQTLAVWGRARYLSVTEAPHNTKFYEWMGKKHFCFFQTAETRKRTPNSNVKGSGANHYPRAPALAIWSRAHYPTILNAYQKVEKKRFILWKSEYQSGDLTVDPALVQQKVNICLAIGYLRDIISPLRHWFGFIMRTTEIMTDRTAKC